MEMFIFLNRDERTLKISEFAVQIFDIVFEFYKEEKLNISGGHIELLYQSADWAEEFFEDNLFTEWKSPEDVTEKLTNFSKVKFRSINN